mmetsp:Transcript_15066/g.31482  ORF Transcript_15066/g.31482 Transcript_15066/m.31482 type:complete len:308 (+) Transcript_15066:74-997(+)
MTLAPSGDVQAKLHGFLIDDAVEPFQYTYQREDGGEQTNAKREDKMVTILDARDEQCSLSLDRHGMILVPHITALPTRDFYERQDRIMGEYYDEVRGLVQQATGASRVIIFDHQVRGMGSLPYALQVHNDYTYESGPQRIRTLALNQGADGPLIPEEDVERLLSQRFMFINVWRNISDDHPIVAYPLAMCDGSSMADDHVVRSAIIYRDRTEYIDAVKYDPSQRWLYFSQMCKNEAILFKGMDSKQCPGFTRYTFHSAFDDPRVPRNAPPRESIEVRCIAFLTEEEDSGRSALPASALFPQLLTAKL